MDEGTHLPVDPGTEPTDDPATALARLIRRQGGVFRRADAYAVGFSRSQVRYRLAQGRWRRLRHGVFVDAERLAAAAMHPALRHALDVAAARLVLDADPVASHSSAARLHEIALPAPPPPERLVLTRPHGQHLGTFRLEVHAAAVSPAERIERHGVPVTSLDRTIVDLARTLPFPDAVVVADAALRLGSVTPADLVRVVHRCRDWPGARQAGSVVAFADARAESTLESLSRVLFHQHAIEPPELQQWIYDTYGGAIGRVDFLWRRRPDRRGGRAKEVRRGARRAACREVAPGAAGAGGLRGGALDVGRRGWAGTADGGPDPRRLRDQLPWSS